MSAAPRASPAGTAATAALAAALLGGYILVLDDGFPNGLIDMVVVVVAAVFALDGRRELPLLARLLITGVLFDFAYGMCLAGRTTEPRLDGDAIGMAFILFLISAFPLATLLCLWPRRIAITLLIAAFPVSLALASLVAGFEERQFVKLHRATGIGPTARWTVSKHWLSYDVEKQQFYGSD